MADKEVLLALKITGDDAGASKSLTAVGTSSSKASSNMQKAGNVAGKVLAVGLVAAGAAAIKATQAAAEDEQAQARLAASLTKNAGATKEQIAATEDWISAMGKQFGVADDELRPALSKLVTVTKDVGEAQKLTRLAMDISAGSGKSLASVTQSLSRAMATGTTTGLAKYGVSMLNAKGETVSMEQATKRLAGAFKGQAAKAAQTTAGQAKILQVQFDELQESIGAKLLPVMTKLTSIGLAAIDWMTQHATITKVVAAAVVGLVTVVFLVGKAIQAWTAITKVATVVQAAFNLVMAANPIVLVTVAIVALGVALVVAYKKSETFRNIVNGAFQAVSKVVVGTVTAVVGFVRDHWKLLLAILTGPFGLAVLGITKYGGKIKSKVTGFVSAVKSFVTNNWKKALLILLTGPFGAAILVIRSKADAIRSKVLGMVTAVVGFFKDKWRDITGLAGDAMSAARDRVASAADSLRDAVTTRVSKVVDFFRGLPGKIKSALGDTGSILKNAGIAVIQGFWDGLQDKWEDVKGWLSSIKDSIPDIKGPPSADAKILVENGKLIMGGLERGLDLGYDRIKRKLDRIGPDIAKRVKATSIPVSLRPASSSNRLALDDPRRTSVVHIAVNGAVDPVGTARQIRDLLNRESLWRGRVVTT